MKTQAAKFLKNNGWIKDTENADSDYISFNKQNYFSVDIGNDEIVVIDGTGDFAHIPMNYYSVYALLGLLFHYHQLDVNYKWI